MILRSAFLIQDASDFLTDVRFLEVEPDFQLLTIIQVAERKQVPPILVIFAPVTDNSTRESKTNFQQICLKLAFDILVQLSVLQSILKLRSVYFLAVQLIIYFNFSSLFTIFHNKFLCYQFLCVKTIVSLKIRKSKIIPEKNVNAFKNFDSSHCVKCLEYIRDRNNELD